MSHLSVTYMTGCVGEQRHFFEYKRRFLYIHVASQRTDRDEVSTVFDVREIFNATDVDEHRRLGQAKFHQRNQAVSTCQKLGFVAILPDE
jgi:hypothetical protein